MIGILAALISVNIATIAYMTVYLVGLIKRALRLIEDTLPLIRQGLNDQRRQLEEIRGRLN